MASAPQLRLRTQFFLVVVLLVATAASALTYYFVTIHRAAIADTTSRKVAMMRAGLADKASTLARNGAVSSARSAVIMDFSLLQKVIAATVAGDSNILYGLIADSDGRIVAHSNPAQVNKTVKLDGDAKGANVVVRETHAEDGSDVVEAIAPIKVGEELWGTVRYGMSLAPVRAAIAESEVEQANVLRNAIIFSVAAVVVLLLVSVIVTALAARPVVRPVARLEDAVQKVLAGQQNTRVEVDAPPDIARVAGELNAMLESISNRTKLLRQDRRRVEIALEEATQMSKTKQVFLTRVWQDLLGPLDRIERDHQQIAKNFAAGEVFICSSCKSVFESGDDSALAKPCPRCKGKLQRGTTARLTGDAETAYKSLRDIEACGTELQRLVNDLLEFSPLEADQRTVQLENLDVPRVIEAAKVGMSVLAEGKRLIWPTKPPAVRLEGDGLRIEQSVTLLVELACQIAPQPSDVRLEVDEVTYHGEAGVQFVVRDDGSGFAKEFLDALRSGAGPDVRATLSMMALRRVADLHHGELSIESEVGRGLTVRLILPLTQPKQVQPAPKRRPVAPAA